MRVFVLITKTFNQLINQSVHFRQERKPITQKNREKQSSMTEIDIVRYFMNNTITYY